MKVINILYVVFSISLTLYGQTKSLRADLDTTAIEYLSNLEFKLDKLLDERDFKSYATYLANDYIRITANGKMSTKVEVLNQLESSHSGAIETIPEILKVRIYGDTAILNIRLTVKEKNETRESLLTKVFILRDGQWFLVALQGTAI